MSFSKTLHKQRNRNFTERILNALNAEWVPRIIEVSGTYSAYQTSEQLICSQFKHDTPLLLQHIFVHTTPYSLQVQLFCVESVRQQHFPISRRSGGAISLVISMDIIHLISIFHRQSKTPNLLSPFHSLIW